MKVKQSNKSMNPEEFETAEELLKLQDMIERLNQEIDQMYKILHKHPGEGISDSCKFIIQKLEEQLGTSKFKFNRLGGKKLLKKFWEIHHEVVENEALLIEQ